MKVSRRQFFAGGAVVVGAAVTPLWLQWLNDQMRKLQGNYHSIPAKHIHDLEYMKREIEALERKALAQADMRAWQSIPGSNFMAEGELPDDQLSRITGFNQDAPPETKAIINAGDFGAAEEDAEFSRRLPDGAVAALERDGYVNLRHKNGVWRMEDDSADANAFAMAMIVSK